MKAKRCLLFILLKMNWRMSDFPLFFCSKEDEFHYWPFASLANITLLIWGILLNGRICS